VTASAVGLSLADVVGSVDVVGLVVAFVLAGEDAERRAAFADQVADAVAAWYVSSRHVP